MKRAPRGLLLGILALLVVACASQIRGRRVPLETLGPMPGLFLTEEEKALDIPIPLEGVTAKVEMIDSMAKVTLSQHYKNPLPKPVKLTYIFPMDETAAITEFSADYSNGRRLVGIVKEKVEAKKEFDDAVEAGHNAVLLEQHSDEVFQVDIGNLEKGQEVTIVITYLTTVPLESRDEYRFTLPTLVAPRYASSTPEPSKDEKSASSYKLKLDLDARMSSPIAAATSATHKLVTRPGPLATQIHLSTEGLVDGDFVILIKMKEAGPEGEKSTILLEKKDAGERAVYVNLKASDFVTVTSSATTSAEEDNTEIYFVVDVSGSMIGGKMEDTIKAMKEAMLQLFEKQRLIHFNIVPFSSEFHSLYEAPKPLNEDSYEEAIEFIDSLRAGGGTELLAPLQHVFSSPSTSRRRVIVITDGLIGNNQEVFDLVKAQQKKNTVVFSIGIGAGVSHSLVNGLASHGSGVAEYVVLGEKVSEKVTRQLTRALSPGQAEILTIAFVDKKGRAVTSGIISSPSSLPPLYSESDARIFAIIPSTVTSVVIQGAPSTKRVQFDLATAPTVKSDILHKMAAKNRIRELELALAAARDATEEEKVDIQKISKDVIHLATTYRLMSSLTSFVAVDPNASTKETAVPISVPAMGERRADHSKLRMMAAAMPPLRGDMAAPQRETDMAYVLNFEQMAKDAGVENTEALLENMDEEPIDPVIQENIEQGVNETLDPDPLIDQTPKLDPEDDDFFLADLLNLWAAYIQVGYNYLYRKIFGPTL